MNLGLVNAMVKAKILSNIGRIVKGFGWFLQVLRDEESRMLESTWQRTEALGSCLGSPPSRFPQGSRGGESV